MTLIDGLARMLGYVRRHAERRQLRDAMRPREEKSGRWEAAETSRLNSEHWNRRRISGQSLNRDLAWKGATLRERSEYELANNGFVEGIVKTHVNDVVGEHGPSLQVQTTDKAYNEALEAGFREWWKMPDLLGRLSGVDMLRMNVRSLWPNGEFLNQTPIDSEAQTQVKTRLLLIDPSRLCNPFPASMDSSITMGVKRDRLGRVLSYFIDERNDGEIQLPGVPRYAEVPASDMIHEFKPIAPGQVRGVPMLSSVLQVIADLRDYDTAVLDAARAAAYWAQYLQSTNPGVEPVELDGTVAVQRGQLNAIPPGYDVKQLQPQQPHTKYVEYRDEKLLEIGRPVNMPLMMVTLDSSGHNYSSARFDGQIYHRGIRTLQGWLERVFLNRILLLVAAELELQGLIPARPADFKAVWTWPVPPHVDPTKEANAEETRMARTGTLTLSDACAMHGRDWERVVEQRKREQDALRAAGLPVPWEQQQAAANTKPVDDGVDDDKPRKGRPVDDDDDREARLWGSRRARSGINAPLLNGATH